MEENCGKTLYENFKVWQVIGGFSRILDKDSIYSGGSKLTKVCE
jgi:hypothetical protein